MLDMVLFVITKPIWQSKETSTLAWIKDIIITYNYQLETIIVQCVSIIQFVSACNVCFLYTLNLFMSSTEANILVLRVKLYEIETLEYSLFYIWLIVGS